MSVVHITYGPRCWSPWLPIPRAWGDTVVTDDCCVRRVPRQQAEFRYGLQEWYDPLRVVKCRTGHGCKADRRLLSGATGRAMFRCPA